MRRAGSLLLVTFACALGAAQQASAHAVMSIADATIVYNGNDDVSLNTLEVSLRGSDVRFLDRGSDGGIMPADGCSPGETDARGFIVEVLCPRAGRTGLRIDVGEGADNVVVTAPLNATVVGGRGADTITGGPGNDALNGGDANDRISGGAGNDQLLGGPTGDDTLSGGDGNDTLQPSVGVDEVDGGNGDDIVQIRDGTADGVSCGAGNDRVQADPADVVRDGACEMVETGQATAETAGTSPGGANSASGQPPVNGGGSPPPGGTPGSAPGMSSGTPPPSTASDRTAPRVRSGGSTLQRLSSSNRLTVLATSSEAGEVLAAGTITVGERRIVLVTARRTIDVAGGGALLRLQVPRSGMRAVRAALAKRRAVRAVITVVATDEAGNSSASKLPSVRLRR